MPVYDFTCADCGKRFDKLFRRREDRPAAACPSCGSKKTQRALSLVHAGAGKGPSQQSQSSDAPPLCGRCGMNGPCVQ